MSFPLLDKKIWIEPQQSVFRRAFDPRRPIRRDYVEIAPHWQHALNAFAGSEHALEGNNGSMICHSASLKSLS